LSALALKERLKDRGRVVSFDLMPWHALKQTALRPEDFEDGRLEQIVADITYPEGAKRHRALFASADLIFVDAAKDGAMESRLLRIFESIEFERAPIIVFDDIRLWNMLDVWRSILRPKLDLTSFGHWSGTGLVDWSG
jgi:predicted O-methyltransferase YrrM